MVRSNIKNVRCPKCGSKYVIKRGKRKQHFEIVQAYQCKECERRFVMKSLEHKMYPTKVIYSAILFAVFKNSVIG